MVLQHWANQSARAAQSTLDAPTQRTGCGSSPGGTATSWASAPTSMPAACSLTAASGGERRLRADQRRRPLSHDDLHWHRGPRQGPGARARPSSRTLPHGIRPAPGPPGVAPGSQDPPHPRAHRTPASPASYNPLVPRQASAVSTPVPSCCPATPWHNHPHKGSARRGQGHGAHPPAPQLWSPPLSLQQRGHDPASAAHLNGEHLVGATL